MVAEPTPPSTAQHKRSKAKRQRISSTRARVGEFGTTPRGSRFRKPVSGEGYAGRSARSVQARRRVRWLGGGLGRADDFDGVAGTGGSGAREMRDRGGERVAEAAGATDSLEAGAAGA